MGAMEVRNWQSAVLSKPRTILNEDRNINLHGANIGALAQYVLLLLEYIYSKVKDPRHPMPFPQSQDVKTTLSASSDLTIQSFLQLQVWRVYKVSVFCLSGFHHLINPLHSGFMPNTGNAVSIGRGIEKSTFREMLTLITDDHLFWQASPAEPHMFTFNLSPLNNANPTRIARFHVHARALALQLIYYGQGLKIGFWPALSLLLGRQSMLLGEAFLQMMSPEVADKMAPWFALSPNDPIPRAPNPVCSLIVEVFNMQVCSFPSLQGNTDYRFGLFAAFHDSTDSNCC